MADYEGYLNLDDLAEDCAVMHLAAVGACIDSYVVNRAREGAFIFLRRAAINLRFAKACGVDVSASLRELDRYVCEHRTLFPNSIFSKLKDLDDIVGRGGSLFR